MVTERLVFDVPLEMRRRGHPRGVTNENNDAWADGSAASRRKGPWKGEADKGCAGGGSVVAQREIQGTWMASQAVGHVRRGAREEALSERGGSCHGGEWGSWVGPGNWWGLPAELAGSSSDVGVVYEGWRLVGGVASLGGSREVSGEWRAKVW